MKTMTWKDRDLNSYTKKELIEICIQLGDLYNRRIKEPDNVTIVATTMEILS